MKLHNSLFTVLPTTMTLSKFEGKIKLVFYNWDMFGRFIFLYKRDVLIYLRVTWSIDQN